jgi:hypothetical protein
MSYSNRLLVISAFAALANLGLLVLWIALGEGLTDLSKLSLRSSLGAVSLAYFFAFLVTAFGISLLVLLASPVLSRASKPVAVSAFILLGALLGAALFCWTESPLLFASCGALSAVLVALFIPSLFGRGCSEATSTSV